MPSSPAQLAQSGIDHYRAGRLPQAIECFRQAVLLDPTSAELLNSLAAALHASGQLQEAEGLFRRAIALRPDFRAAHTNLGLNLQQQNRLAEGIECHRRALQIDPNSVQALNNLGLVWQAQRRYQEAEACYRKAIEFAPDIADVRINLGAVLKEMGRLDEAIEALRRAIELRPDHPTAHYNLGATLAAAQRIDEAVASYRRAIELNPQYADARGNLANLLMGQGLLDQAIECYRQLMALRPLDASAHSSLLYAMQAHPHVDDAMLLAEHRLWDQRHAQPLRVHIRPHANDRDPDRALRIGYVSPDLGLNVVGRLLGALLQHQDAEHFQIACYSGTARPDAMTERFKRCCHLWRDTAPMDDQRLADQIRQDRIDVLVDLSQHGAGNRLLVFARKPAPVQVSYLGYNAPTGLATIDYRLTDRYMEGSGFRVQGSGADSALSLNPEPRTLSPERPFPLPNCYWCYTAPDEAPPVNDLPALRAGRITFVSFNSFARVHAETISLWADVLKASPQAQLAIVIAGGQRTHVWEAFARRGIDRQRVLLWPRRPFADYWRLHQDVDIALDTFPYNGGVTSLDALWMGIPIVTLAGQRTLARAGVSILSNIGLPELIATTPQQYVRIAADLATDLPRLRQLRATLRQRMQQSPLMDAPRFARNVETAYRQMWQTWRKSQRD